MAMSILLCVIFRDPRAPNELFGKNKNGNTKPKNEKTKFQQTLKTTKNGSAGRLRRTVGADGRLGGSHFLIFIGKSIFHFFIFLFFYYFNKKYRKFHFLYNSQSTRGWPT